jgi:hypothetical protein
MPERRSPAPKSRRADSDLLQLLLGTWRTEGELVGEPANPRNRLVAVDRYEWVPGLDLLAHYVAGHLGRSSVASFEILAYGRRTQSYVSTSFDENGVPSMFRSRLRDGEWTIAGETQRFRGSFSKDRLTISGTWDQKTKGIWKPWLTVTLRKAGA